MAAVGGPPAATVLHPRLRGNAWTGCKPQAAVAASAAGRRHIVATGGMPGCRWKLAGPGHVDLVSGRSLTRGFQENRMRGFLSLGRRLVAMAVLGVACAGAQAADPVDVLAQDVERLESLRQVKDLQRTYVHLAQAGLWNEMAALFARDGQFIHGEERATGVEAIAKWLTARQG